SNDSIYLQDDNGIRISSNCTTNDGLNVKCTNFPPGTGVDHPYLIIVEGLAVGFEGTGEVFFFYSYDAPLITSVGVSIVNCNGVHYNITIHGSNFDNHVWGGTLNSTNNSAVVSIGIDKWTDAMILFHAVSYPINNITA